MYSMHAMQISILELNKRNPDNIVINAALNVLSQHACWQCFVYAKYTDLL